GGCGGQGDRARAAAELRRLPADADRLPDHRLRDFRLPESVQPRARAGARGRHAGRRPAAARDPRLAEEVGDAAFRTGNTGKGTTRPRAAKLVAFVFPGYAMRLAPLLLALTLAVPAFAAQ